MCNGLLAIFNRNDSFVLGDVTLVPNVIITIFSLGTSPNNIHQGTSQQSKVGANGYRDESVIWEWLKSIYAQYNKDKHKSYESHENMM